MKIVDITITAIGVGFLVTLLFWVNSVSHKFIALLNAAQF